MTPDILKTFRKHRSMGGARRVLVPWPTGVLGAYGANQTTDADMDSWVRANIIPSSEKLEITGICPGNAERDGVATPCIVVTMLPKDRQYTGVYDVWAGERREVK